MGKHDKELHSLMYRMQANIHARDWDKLADHAAELLLLAGAISQEERLAEQQTMDV